MNTYFRNMAIALTLALASVFGPPVAAQVQPIRLVPVLQGLSLPLFVGHAGDGSNRLFVVQQGGRIVFLPNGASAPKLFLDLSSKVVAGGEQGLLGLAFHPGFRTNRRFYVDYTRAGDGATVIAEYVAAEDPLVTRNSERVLLVIPQPFANHNGGMLAFGPDGFLYIGMGDGGSANDPGNRAQNIDELLGKILRIDVDHASATLPYASPPDNPFFGATPGRDEIFAIGMRNPFRFSFDRGTGQLYVGDVGQNAIEEIDIVQRGGNYGWRVFEGTSCTGNDPALCSGTNYLPPIAQYSHAAGRCSVTGGYVYRGRRGTFPAGTYVFGDFCTGEIFYLAGSTPTVLLDTTLSISSFGEDEAGELYVADLNGAVYRISPQTTNDTATTLTSSTQTAAASIAVTFTATISGNAPTGTVTFTADNAPIAGCAAAPVTTAATSATATCTTGALTPGAHAIGAGYSGDATNEPSGSSLAQTVTPTTFGNGGFETPSFNGGFQYAPPGATWVFSASAGIAGNGNGFTAGNPAAPEGVQVAFLQNANSRFTQTMPLSAGQYTVSFKAAQRGNWQMGTQIVVLQVDGVTIGQFQPPSPTYTSFTTGTFTVSTSGNHSLAFVGTGSGGTDFTAFVDDVRLVAVSTGATSTNLGSSSNPAPAGAGVTFTATVTGAAPTGTVAFAADGATLAGCGAVALVGSGNARTAQCATSNLALGTHPIVATYGGDATNASSSATLNQVITSSGVANGGFESPSLGGSFMYRPSGATWIFTGGAGITGNANAFTSGNPGAPEGVQVGFLQSSNSQISQTLQLDAGQYMISIAAAQRGNWQFGTQIVVLQVDGVMVGQFQPPGTTYTAFTTPAFTVPTAGSHTVTLRGAGSGSDFTAFVDNVRVVATPVVLANAGFETPAVPGSFVYRPTGAGWTFTAGAGVTGNGSGFTSGNQPAPGGLQAAFLQNAGSRIAQTVTFPVGQFRVSFQAAQRANWQFGTQVIRVELDGIAVGQFQPPSTSYTPFTSPTFSVTTAGPHTLSLVGIGTCSDCTAFVDDVRVQ